MKFSTTLLVLAQFVHTGTKLVLFVFLTQFGGFSVAGSYTYALAIISPVFILFGFSLRKIFVTAPHDVYMKDFLLLRSIYGTLAILSVLVIAAMIRPELFSLFAAMAAYRFVESLVDLRIAFFQRSSRVTLMALSTLLLAFITTGTVATVYALSKDLPFSVATGAISGFLLFLLLSLLNPKTKPKPSRPSLTFREAARISKNGLSLSVSGFLVSLSSGIPILILEAFHNEAAVGAYSAIYYISAMSNILFGAISQAELRVFARLVAAGHFKTFMKRARKFSWYLSLAALLFAVPMYFVGTDIFSYVFGEDFSDYQAALMAMVLTVCLAPFSFFLDVQLVALQRFSIQTAISIITLVFTALCGFVLIPTFSIFGATLTLFLTMFARNLVKSQVVHRMLPNAR